MKLKSILIFIFFLGWNSPILYCQSYCQDILKKATTSYQRGQLEKAMRQLQDAETCDYKNDLQKERQELERQIFEAVDRAKNEAITNQNKAIKAKREAEQQTRKALANDIAYKAQQLLAAGNRTTAFQLAAFTYTYVDTANNVKAAKAISDAYYYNDHPKRKEKEEQLSWHRNFPGQQTAVSAVAFSPDGQRLLTGGTDGIIMHREAVTTKVITTFLGHDQKITSLAFVPDGQSFVSSSNSLPAKLWNSTTGELVKTFPNTSDALSGNLKNLIKQVAISPNGKYLMTVHQGNIVFIWDITTSKRKFEQPFGHKTDITSVAFSPDSQYFLTGSGGKEGVAKLWDLTTGTKKLTITGSKKPIIALTFKEEGKAILITRTDKITRHDVENGQLLGGGKLAMETTAKTIFSPNGKYLLTSKENENFVVIKSVASKKIIGRFKGHNAPITAFAFSPNSQFVLTGGADKLAKLWKIERGPKAKTITTINSSINDLAISPKGKYAILGVETNRKPKKETPLGTALIWDIAEEKVIDTLKGHLSVVKSVAYSQNGKYLLTGSKDKTAILWDANTKKIIHIFKVSITGEVNAVAFSPDSQLLATASSDKTAILWDITSKKPLRKFIGHEKGLSAIAFSPKGDLLLTGSYDYTAKVWSLTKGNLLRTFKMPKAVSSVAFSPDGTAILTGSDDNIVKLWRVADGQEISSFEGHTSKVTSVTFYDANTIITASEDRSIRLWNALEGREIRSFHGHTGAINALIVAPRKNYVVSVSKDKTAKIWLLNMDSLPSIQNKNFLLTYFNGKYLKEYGITDIIAVIPSAFYDVFLNQADHYLLGSVGDYLFAEMTNNHNPANYNIYYRMAEGCYKNAIKRAPTWPIYTQMLKKLCSVWREKLEANEQFEKANTITTWQKNRLDINIVPISHTHYNHTSSLTNNGIKN